MLYGESGYHDGHQPWSEADWAASGHLDSDFWRDSWWCSHYLHKYTRDLQHSLDNPKKENMRQFPMHWKLDKDINICLIYTYYPIHRCILIKLTLAPACSSQLTQDWRTHATSSSRRHKWDTISVDPIMILSGCSWWQAVKTAEKLAVKLVKFTASDCIFYFLFIK